MRVSPCLETKRLVLRAALPLDRPFVRRLLTDAAVRRYLGGVVAPKDLEAAVTANLARDDGEDVWIVASRAGGKAALVALTWHRDGQDIELSYQFCREAWGRGFAREALVCVRDYALGERGLARVIAETQAANARSVRLLRDLGMREVARLERFGAAQVIFGT
ncbi:MAG: GNAT family N-acetyltransferase [Pseudomonadota bacterium]